MKNYIIMDSPVGRLTLCSEGGKLTGLHFGIHISSGFVEGDAYPLEVASRQLTEYFDGSRRAFDLPLELSGTDFQRSVWNKLQKIPYGETCSYGDIARAIGNPKASRAVGMANNRNPVSIIVPCHRVIGAGGKLVGYGGGVSVKSFLLDLESGVMAGVSESDSISARR